MSRGVAAHYKPAETPTISLENVGTVLEMLGEGRTFAQIAAYIGTKRWNVANWVRRYEDQHGRIPRPGRGNPQVIQQWIVDTQDDTSGERCRCGLRLPCNSCIPSIYEYATNRRERP